MKTKVYGVDAKNIVARLRLFGNTYRRIAKMTGISKSSVQRWVSQHGITKHVANATNRFRFWSENLREVLESYMHTNPFCTLSDIHEAIRNIPNAKIPKSLSTVSNWVRRHLKFTRKRATGKYLVRNNKVSQATDIFKDRMQHTQPHEFLSIDETSVYFSESSKYGYTKRGMPLRQRAHTETTQHVRKRITLLMAVSSSRVVHYACFQGSCNSQRFAEFVRSIPNNCKERFALLDNVAFHKSRIVSEAFKASNIAPVFVPPYSPDFNPIENVFAILKQSFRRHVDRCGCLVDNVIPRLILSVPETSLKRIFQHCWGLLKPI
jgi:transposase